VAFLQQHLFNHRRLDCCYPARLSSSMCWEMGVCTTACHPITVYRNHSTNDGAQCVIVFQIHGLAVHAHFSHPSIIYISYCTFVIRVYLYYCFMSQMTCCPTSHTETYVDAHETWTGGEGSGAGTQGVYGID